MPGGCSRLPVVVAVVVTVVVNSAGRPPANGRGVDRLRFDMNIFDLTPLGRQEEWEESPDGWPRAEARFAVIQKDGPGEHV